VPNYDFRCDNCGEIFERKLSYETIDQPTKEPCPECQTNSIVYVPSFSGLGDPIKLGITRPPDAFLHGVLGRMKSSVPNTDFSKARFQPGRLI
jgi:putative FmdB family regulatory protein